MDVPVDRDSRPVLLEPMLAGGVALDEGDGAEACPLKPEVEATYMPEKRLRTFTGAPSLPSAKSALSRDRTDADRT